MGLGHHLVTSIGTHVAATKAHLSKGHGPLEAPKVYSDDCSVTLEKFSKNGIFQEPGGREVLEGAVSKVVAKAVTDGWKSVRGASQWVRPVGTESSGSDAVHRHLGPGGGGGGGPSSTCLWPGLFL